MSSKKPIISLKNVEKSFQVKKGKVEVLKDVDLDIYPGEFVIIYGPSGCGKSTLLNTIVGLERPTKGEVIVRGQDIYELSADQRAVIRRQKFGIIYQQPSWIKPLSVVENVAFPLNMVGTSERKSIARAKKVLYLFSLDEYVKNMPTELSGGQQQRVSVARALITNPWILVADEPTGNLDTVSAGDLMYQFKFLNEESKRTILMVTHNPEYEKYATKIVRMKDGKITKIETKKEIKVGEDEVVADILPEEA